MARDSFTDHQWQQLLEAGPAIARSVAAATGGGAETEQELGAFLRLLEETRNEIAGTELLGSVVSDMHARLSSGALAIAAEDAVTEGIHAARRAGAVLSLEPDEQQARAVRHWLLEVGRTVAAASREGGVLGLGGQDVSKGERDVLYEIADALGLAAEAGETADVQPNDEPASSDQPRADDQLTTDLEEGPPAEADFGPDGQPIGSDNIREGKVRGTMGGPHQSEGEGQGGGG